jgi:GNAT superfamily N-acetyltransferase
MLERINISNTDPEAIVYAIASAKREGWNPGLNDVDLFPKVDPNGLFLARLNKEPIGCASAVCYDKSFAFFGLYIVDALYRGKGYGMQITQERLNYVKDRCVGLDGVIENEHIYKKIGFQHQFLSKRHQLNAKLFSDLQQNSNVYPIFESDLDEIYLYDHLCFPAVRNTFLFSWIMSPNAYSFCYRQNGSIKGYLVMRKCYNGYKVGPLYADEAIIANALLNQALITAHDAVVYIDVPNHFSHIQDFIQLYKTEVIFACIRMYRNGVPQVDEKRVFGISTFEIG